MEQKPLPPHRNQILDALPQATLPQGQLLRAVLHLNAGRFAEAAHAGQQLLSMRDTEASAHFLLGVCLEHSGDEAGARNRYAAAARADPTFALSHLRARNTRQAVMVELRFFEGLSLDEIAAQLLVSPATVKRELRGGLEFLRRCLGGFRQL